MYDLRPLFSLSLQCRSKFLDRSYCFFLQDTPSTHPGADVTVLTRHWAETSLTCAALNGNLICACRNRQTHSSGQTEAQSEIPACELCPVTQSHFRSLCVLIQHLHFPCRLVFYSKPVLVLHCWSSSFPKPSPKTKHSSGMSSPSTFLTHRRKTKSEIELNPASFRNQTCCICFYTDAF